MSGPYKLKYKHSDFPFKGTPLTMYGGMKNSPARGFWSRIKNTVAGVAQKAKSAIGGLFGGGGGGGGGEGGGVSAGGVPQHGPESHSGGGERGPFGGGGGRKWGGQGGGGMNTVVEDEMGGEIGTGDMGNKASARRVMMKMFGGGGN